MSLIKATTGILISSCIGFIGFGFDGGLMSGILTNGYFIDTFDNPNATLQGQISALFDLGCFFGALSVFAYGDRFGRRTVILVGSVVHIVGGVIQACSYSSAQLIVGRIVAGYGCGCITVAIPVWISETTSPSKRGEITGLVIAFNMFGGVIVTLINYGMRYVKSHFSWRFPLALQVLFPIICLILIPLFPESPRWLISKDRSDEAKTSISRLLNTSIDSEEVQTMYSEVTVHVDEERAIASERSVKDLFGGKDKLHNLRRIILGALSQLMQQTGGNNTILYYQPSLFQNSLGMSESLSLILAAVNSINVTICGVLNALFLVERVNRKTIMMGGSLSQGTCMVLIAVGIALDSTKGSILSIVFMFGFYSTFGFSWGFAAWNYPPEINSQQYRNLGAATSTATNWIFNYIVVLITPIGVENIGWKFFLIFAVLNYCFVPVIFIFFVETKGLSLEEIDEVFLRKNPDSTLPVVEYRGDKPEAEHVE